MNIDNDKLVKRYLSLRTNSITAKSKKAFEWDLSVFLKFLDDKSIENVIHIDIYDFLAYCRDERNNGDEALSRKYNTLNTFYKTMIKNEFIDMKNPLDKVEKIKVRKKTRDEVTLTEYKQIINYLITKKDIRGLALISLLYSSGIRISELHQLNKNSLDFDSRSFYVIGKGDKAGECSFSEEAKKYILEYLNTRTDDLDALFISREHNRWSIKAIQDYVKKVAIRAGITKNISPHKYRHGFAMLLLDNDVPINEIQKALRHSNISTTQIYAQTSYKRTKESVDSVFSKIL